MHAAGSGDSAANVDVPADGEIIGLTLEIATTANDAAGDGLRMEVSFGSTNQFTTNDARNVLGSIMLLADDIQTAENNIAVARMAVMLGSPGMPVAAGERIHMHVGILGAASSFSSRAILYFMFAGTLRLRRR